MRAEILMELFTRAEAEPFGLVVETNNPHGIQTCVDRHGLKSAFPDLMICLPSLKNTIFIVKKSVELDS